MIEWFATQTTTHKDANSWLLRVIKLSRQVFPKKERKKTFVNKNNGNLKQLEKRLPFKKP